MSLFNVIPQDMQLSALTLIRTNRLVNSYLGLIVNSFVPSPTKVLGDISGNECTDGGYARIQLTSWTSPALLGGIAFTLSMLATFTFSGTGNIYGFFLTDVSSGYSGNLWLLNSDTTVRHAFSSAAPYSLAVSYTESSQFTS